MKTRVFLFMILLVLATALPGFAQENAPDPVQPITIDGLSMSIAPSFAPAIHMMRYIEPPMDTMPIEPPHTAIMFSDDMMNVPGVLESNGTIFIYDVDTIDGGDREYANRIAALRDLLAERPDLNTFLEPNASGMAVETTLPFLPVFPAAQVIRAQPQYVELDGLTGISYITVFRQGVGPFVANEFMLTFQGVSDNGDTVITAVFPVEANVFPQEEPANLDFDVFMETYETYMVESVEALTVASSDDFTPSLDTLTQLISNLAYE